MKLAEPLAAIKIHEKNCTNFRASEHFSKSIYTVCTDQFMVVSIPSLLLFCCFYHSISSGYS